MKSEELRQTASRAIEELAATLEAGQSEALTSYLSAVARFHRYSLHNVFLIAMQKPTATYVAGFHTWKKLGRFVKKGEKGIYILAPLVSKRSGSESVESEDEAVLLGFRACAVFDYSQTEGPEMPTIGKVAGEPAFYHTRLVAFVSAQGISLVFSDAIAPAHGVSHGGRIILLPGMAAAETFLTLVHEFAHELLHRERNRGELSKRQRETEAEAVAYVVCNAIGLETGTACQDYIQLYRGDAQLLTDSLENVRRAASQILRAICDEEDQGFRTAA
ncbi:MAG TPA: ArdC family protein [Candidatus Acidoferrum sp.]|nr:ArdC family protein [Candidatus Acidoferrum sp.]